MRRTILLFALSVLAASLGFANGQSEPALGVASAEEPVTLNFYHYATQTHVLYLRPLMEAFQRAHPNIRLRAVEVASGGYEALSQRILLGLAAGDPPDIGQVGYNLLRTMVDSGGAVALDPFMAEDSDFRADNLFPAMMSLGQVDGRQYLVPIGTSTPAMLSNTELFAEVGLDPNRPPASWEETREAAVTLTEAGKLGVLWGWSITGNWIFQAMLENAGGRMADETGSRAAFNDEAGLRTLSYLVELARDGLMPVTDQTIATFIAGNLGMLVDSSLQRINTPQQAAFPVRFSPMPTPDGSPPLVPAGGNGAMIFSQDAAKQQASWQFIRWLTEEEASRIVADTSGYTPANQAVVRALQAEHADDENYRVMLEQAARVTPWYSWPGQHGNEISQILRDMQEAALLGRKSPQQALDDAAAEINALLE